MIQSTMVTLTSKHKLTVVVGIVRGNPQASSYFYFALMCHTTAIARIPIPRFWEPNFHGTENTSMKFLERYFLILKVSDLHVELTKTYMPPNILSIENWKEKKPLDPQLAKETFESHHITEIQ